MSFIDKLSARLPFGKKEEVLEYYFALNIGIEQLTAALWTIEGKELKILATSSENYSSSSEIPSVTDKLLDQVIGLKEIEPQKILFGVPNSWISDDNLKDDYLKILRNLVKELELTPMAYVAAGHALIHFLEKQEGVPTTAILVGFESEHLTVTVVRAGKLDGVKVVKRGENPGSDIEKVLLTYTDVETLPSKILIYGVHAQELKSQLLSFSWMSKLSFLHFPKIEVLGEELEIKSVCLAGASEIKEDVSYTDQPLDKQTKKSVLLGESEKEKAESDFLVDPQEKKKDKSELVEEKEDFGFVVGDVSKQEEKEFEDKEVEEDLTQELEDTQLAPIMENESLEIEDFEPQDFTPPPPLPAEAEHKKRFNLKRFIPKGNFTTLLMLLGVIGILFVLTGAYIFLPKADVKIFVEPKILEKDAQVTADPNQKTVNEDAKIIPGQIVETEVSGTSKDSATGKKQVGDPAKGTVIIRNKTDESITLSKGTQFSANGQKFILDVSVSVASKSADDGTWGKSNGTVTAAGIGADGNLPSGTDFTVAGYSSDKMVAKSEGNFSGGTSKDVTVVSSDDQQRLLAKLSSDLRQQAQQKLQEKLPNKKVLAEALSESIVKKSFNKNINDQASEFSLNLTVHYKGTAFEDADLRLIVSKLVTTQEPDGFQLDKSNIETQADVSSIDKSGKLIFLAKFKAKLIPKIDTEKIKNQIKFKTPDEVSAMLKGMDNILGSEIKFTPNLPKPLQRLPLLTKNIHVEVGLK